MVTKLVPPQGLEPCSAHYKCATSPSTLEGHDSNTIYSRLGERPMICTWTVSESYPLSGRSAQQIISLLPSSPAILGPMLLRPFASYVPSFTTVRLSSSASLSRSLLNGAQGRTRTDTPLRATDFESAASTNSATRAGGFGARGWIYTTNHRY